MSKRLVLLAAFLAIIAVYAVFSSYSFAYLLYQHYPGVSYYYISTDLTKNEPNVIRKSQLLVDYVHENVFPCGGLGCKDLPPFDNLVRGVGWCDQVAHLFIRLLEPVDIRGYLVFLNASRDGSGPSPHSVAVITPGDKKRLEYSEVIKEGVIVDVLQGVIFRNALGGVATFDAVCHRDILESQRRYFETDNPAFGYDVYCNKGRSFLSNTPLSLDNNKRKMFYKYVYPFLPKKIIELYQDLTLDKWYRRWYPGEEDFLYYRARNYHVYGRFSEALRLYDMLIDESKDITRVTSCLFFEGMVYFRLKEYKNAKMKFARLIAIYPDSPWNAFAKRWIGESERMIDK